MNMPNENHHRPVFAERADLEWRDERTPVSKRFDDVYFSKEDGLAESRFVFLEGVGGFEGLFSVAGDDGRPFSILETGFGTGLNFLVTWAAWKEWRPESKEHPKPGLTFVSVEGFPLSKKDLEAALSHWPELSEEAEALVQAYPPLSKGTHVLDFEDGAVRLILLIGEISEVLPGCSASIDAIYLDGFAPAKNPEMWCEAVYEQLGRLSHKGTRLATFTAAGHVRRGLQACGFEMQKVAGFGRKRERLVGTFSGESDEKDAPVLSGLPRYYALPDTRLPYGASVAVVGAGIAGNTMACHLHRAGFQVDLYDRFEAIASGASGNPAAMFEPTLLKASSELGAYLRASFFYAASFYDDLAACDEEIWAAKCGSLHLPKDEEDWQRLQDIVAEPSLPEELFRLVTASEASELCGLEIEEDALWYQTAGCLETSALARALVRGVSVHTGNRVHSICRAEDEAKWLLLDDRDISLGEFDAVVLCNGYDAVHFEQCCRLPLHLNKGQVTTIPVLSSKDRQKAIVSGRCYISPPVKTARGERCQVLGATYEQWKDDNPESWTAVTDENRQDNLKRLGQHFPEWAAELEQEADGNFGDRASLRATVSDRFPIAGPLPRLSEYDAHYQGLHIKGHPSRERDPLYYNGLYCSVGHGSRGFVTAPLVAAYVTALLTGQPLPLAAKEVAGLHPARFAVRKLKKGKKP
ncbi:bifunctional tRNA (5-methylaminomethyl-2-thiouridine)(34)-methyltransferase MnmD/FAD-dependent 5-carboxymethylaminomethyl-2-thiouridine(34) oxidoreductase MnmC [Kiloniella sp. b19]|uniref:bifunctional tRNA (5-methylaminomethyl-2-thiouridine)(34)-methyltransferase MnmD/FAD-dependent 5-carboxymethylaminomethyl-2-thiouridine(34) oxidoreductase MnmC n=1 Tax=Kiloniella sp. GXU_MW_B19 TaxID=3141326 RepID=UPI0031D3755C